MQKANINFELVKSLLKNRYIVREWLLKDGYYIDDDKHESMTNKFYDGIM